MWGRSQADHVGQVTNEKAEHSGSGIDSDADSFGDDDFEEHPFVDAKAWADMEVDAICEAAEARMRRLEGDLAEVDIYTRERPSRPWWEMS
jgi:hypothetical protein